MKTVEDLNKKVLYRLVKVIYFVVLLLILIKLGSIFFEKSTIYPYNHEKTAITCLVGPNKNDTLSERIDIKKDKYNITGNLTGQQKERIASEICNVPTQIMFETETTYGDLFLTHNNIFIASEGVMEEKFRFFYFAGICIALLIAGATVTEVIRRVVYYVFLGTLTPKL